MAVRVQDLLDRGEVAEYAGLARLVHVSRPRMTQIKSLMLLAPAVQEVLLFLARTDGGRGPVGPQVVHRICAAADRGGSERRGVRWLARGTGAGGPVCRPTR